MTTIELSGARAHTGRYAREAAKGQQFIISERNKPLAFIGPAPQSSQATIPADFDHPIQMTLGK